MILKTVLQLLKDKTAQKGALPQPPETSPSEGSEVKRSNKKVKVLIFVTAGIIASTAGFVLTVSVLNYLSDRREAPAFSPFRVSSPSGTPGNPMAPHGFVESQPKSYTPPAGETKEGNQRSTAGEPVLPKGQAMPERSVSAETPASIPQGNGLKKEASAKPVSEYDPFKTEFLKKYEEAEKKEKKSKKKGGPDPSLTDLESAIKGTPQKSSLPVQPVTALPALPRKEKELKLTVYGVVISKGDTYAISERGIIREGNTVDAFTVEKVDFEMVTLKNKDDDKDIRNVYVTPKGSDGQKAGQQPGFFQPGAAQTR